ncbi:MAG: hypothetical protein R3284_13000, partial [Rubricoccaceae bacterium]|nr:hypothetical protein [Rubricoccaceae bacterium]
LYLDVLGLLGTGVVLVLLLPSGLTAYIQGLALVHAIGSIVAAVWLQRARGIRIADLVSAILSPLIPAGIAWMACSQILAPLQHGAGMIASTAIVTIVFLGVYTLVLRMLFAEKLLELTPYLPFQLVFRRALMLG